MNKKKKVLMVVISLLVIGIIFGIYKLVDYQIRLYRSVLAAHNRITIIDEFLSESFPDQVKIYIDSKKNNILPTNSVLEK